MLKFYPLGSLHSPSVSQGQPHRTKCWDCPSEGNQEAPRDCSRIWFLHLRITLSECFLSSHYEIDTHELRIQISLAKTPLVAKMMMLEKALPICPERLRREKQNCRARRYIRDNQDQHKRFTDKTRASERLLMSTQDSVLPPRTTVPSPGLRQWVRSILLLRNTFTGLDNIRISFQCWYSEYFSETFMRKSLQRTFRNWLMVLSTPLRITGNSPGPVAWTTSSITEFRVYYFMHLN